MHIFTQDLNLNVICFVYEYYWIKLDPGFFVFNFKSMKMNSTGISFLEILIIEHFWSFAWYTPPYTCMYKKVVRIWTVVHGKSAKTSVILQAFFDMVVHDKISRNPIMPTGNLRAFLHS